MHLISAIRAIVGIWEDGYFKKTVSRNAMATLQTLNRLQDINVDKLSVDEIPN